MLGLITSAKRVVASTTSTTSIRSLSSSLPPWATYDPASLGEVATPCVVQNIVKGQFQGSKQSLNIIHPLDKDKYPIFTIPDTSIDEIGPFVESLRKCPKSGLHNPLKNPERYVEYGEISRKVCILSQINGHFVSSEDKLSFAHR